MIIRIDPNDSRPIYRQVADEIKMLIAAGKLREGMPLPPVRQIAADLGVNLNTIATAYRELQEENLISIRHGAGAVVTSRRSTEGTSKRELRKRIRTALTQLVIAGMPRDAILSLVSDELSDLMKGAKG
jgi:GntR family transcriptional regulator